MGFEKGIGMPVKGIASLKEIQRKGKWFGLDN
jgi:hypothetical protein